MAKFDEISVGDRAEVLHVITERDLQRFVELTGDDNRLHVDSEYASRTPFKNRVVHGMLGAAFISTVVGTKLPGDGALWFSQTLEFIAPVRLGDEIKVVATVTDKLARDSVIVLSTEIFNQHKQKVTSGTARVKLVEPRAPANTAPPGVSGTARVAMVVGASGGVGAAVARRFSARGYDLILVYRSDYARLQPVLGELSGPGRCLSCIQADVTEEAQVIALRDGCRRFCEGLDYVVNTATAPIASVPLADLEWEDFEEHLAANVKSSFLLAKYLSPLMSQRQAPGFAFISSQAADVPVSGWSPYVTAKSALNGLVRTLALELAPLGIRANLVAPGMIDTELIANVPQKTRLMIEAKAPRRRLATPDDVAAAVLFLSSDDGDYITGETLRVNGGQVMI